MTFRVGQKVVCVDSGLDGAKAWVDGEAPIVGRIYTVKEVGISYQMVCVQLVEIARSPRFPDRWGYRSSRFRPIVERKTDISIFTKMLTPQGVDA